EIDETGNLCGADRLQAVDYRYRLFRRTKQASRLEIAVEGMVHQRRHIILGKPRGIQRGPLRTSQRRLTEGWEHEWRNLDQVERTLEIVVEGLAREFARPFGILANESVQHHRD